MNGFGDWVYVALLWTALLALPGAIKALPVAWKYWRAAHKAKDAAAVATTGGALMVAAGISLHALEEIAYKSGRIWQLLHGENTYQQAGVVLIVAGLLGIASLTLAIHYLNRADRRVKTIYWEGQALIALAFVLL